MVRIGSCAACGERARVEHELCGGCLPTYGPRLGRHFRLIRECPEFALACYRRLPEGPKRDRFVRLFGLPEGLRAG